MIHRPGLRPRVERKRAGFALLAVIWGTGLIAMLVVAFMTNGRLRLQFAQNIARATEAAYLAESAIHLATLPLLTQRDAMAGPGVDAVSNGAPKFCVLDRAAVALAVEEESGKIDINAATPELMSAAMVGLGLNESRARQVAEAIIAWRTPAIGGFGQIKPTGDKPLEPKQALFETPLELDQVSGIDPDLFRALLPFVTVYSRTSGVDPRAAPPGLFAALSGLPVEDVRALTAAPYPNQLNRTDPRFPASFNQAGDRSAFLIHAEVLLASGQTAARDAILDLRPPSGKQFAFREMRRGQSKYVERLRAIIASNGAGVPDC
ncbi:MAG: general secretion pathway protein GspK [Methylocystis sp.]|uniref:general secretion pathway protein GspK n=1 Tax=Methylocystis sp. TaxID=1911079 RepID=UPI003DA330BC